MARVKFFKNQTSNTSLVRINLHKKRIKKQIYLKKKASQIGKIGENVKQQEQRHENEYSFDQEVNQEVNQEQDDSTSNFYCHVSNLIIENDIQSTGLNDEFDENCNENEDYQSLFDENEEIDIDKNEKEQKKSQKNYEFIFKNSRLTLPEFNLFYRWICQKMKLNKSNRDLLLSFIKSVLPVDNIIPTSYYMLLCSECYSMYKSGCENESCVNTKSKKSIDALVFDFKYHIRHIVEKYWTEIQIYKGNSIKTFFC
jgi:hypothetical protein